MQLGNDPSSNSRSRSRSQAVCYILRIPMYGRTLGVGSLRNGIMFLVVDDGMKSARLGLVFVLPGLHVLFRDAAGRKPGRRNNAMEHKPHPVGKHNSGQNYSRVPEYLSIVVLIAKMY